MGSPCCMSLSIHFLVTCSDKELSVMPVNKVDVLEAWKVPQIMAALPVILLVALMLFFSGLLIQLWNISDRTTATAVTFIVSVTVLLVILTTVVPACVSTKFKRSSFAPFRSPQAWIFFLVVRRFARWYSLKFDPTAKFLSEHPPILSSWSEFDLHFLKVETARWFEHSTSSVHRALRWVVEVLRNSNEMEKSLLWCLHSKLYPQNLAESESGLRNYVLLGPNKEDRSVNLDRAYYDYSAQNEGMHTIESAIGQRQAELLVRSAHRALDVSSDPQKSWDAISYACDTLWHHDIFNKYSGQDIVHRTSPHPTHFHL